MHEVHFGVEYESCNFREDWKKTRVCERDGCSSIRIIPFHNGRCTEAVKSRFYKKMQDREGPDSYQVCAYDLGILNYKVFVKKNKIVNHKRMQVTEVKEYKSKPKHIVSGGIVKENHMYICDYDFRVYDYWEHH